MKKIKIGYYIPPKKLAKMKDFPQLSSFLAEKNAELVCIDLNENLEEQLKGIDVFFHKLTDELSPGSETARITKFEEYCTLHPELINVDPVQNQRRVMNRSVINDLLLKIEEKLPSEMKFRMPRHTLFSEEKPVYDTSSFSFPVICKTTVACGSGESHMMGIVFEEKGLHAFQVPFIAQEFYNHNSTIYKVFTIGDYVKIVKRPSLPNMPSSFKETVFFDSQKPFAPQMQSLKNPNEKSDEELVGEAPLPPMETIKAISEAIRSTLGLNIFGFDVITQLETGNHAAVDINYFPSFGGVENFWNIFGEFLLSKVKK